MRLSNIHESFGNKETIVFHASPIGVLGSIIKNGLGGEGKQANSAGGTIGGLRSGHAGEYVTRHLWSILHYAHQFTWPGEEVPSPSAIIALDWTDTSQFEYDEDELDLDPQSPYDVSSYAVRGADTVVAFAWEYTQERGQKIAAEYGVDYDHEEGLTSLPDNVAYMSGWSAIRWIDKRFEMIYKR